MAVWVVAAIWVALMLRLQVADVWDETVGMVFFGDASRSLGEKFAFIATESLGFWRPIPTFLAAFVLHVVPDFDVNFRVLRVVNIAFLLGAVAVLIAALEIWAAPHPALRVAQGHPLPAERGEGLRRFAFVAAVLFSGSAIITAGWYANVYDAMVLLLMSYALLLIARGRDLAAGVVFGIAFFCKETAALSFPLLVILLAAKRITFARAIRIGVPAAILGAIYFVIRAKIVPFGSTTDVHQFHAEHLWPTAVGLVESFWRQNMKSPGFLGFVWMAVFLAALRKPRVIGATLLFLAACVVVYWGMFLTYQNGVVISHLNFIGRLYLIPAVMLLFILALESRPLALAILFIPIVLGAYSTYRDHLTFQRTYKRVYRTAREAAQKPLRVHYPEKPLQDPVRGIEIGNQADAPVHIDARTGKVVFR